LGEAFFSGADALQAFAVKCYPATPDSLGVLPKPKLHELMCGVCAMRKLLAKKPKAFWQAA
jgi:hypothetical protein